MSAPRSPESPVGPPAGAVVVGVDLDGSRSAVAFGAEEAARSLCPLHLVHVVRTFAVEGSAGAIEGAHQAADTGIQLALERARDVVAHRVPVTAERVDGGGLVDVLVDRGARGSMLVLEHRRLGRLRRFVTGSVVSGAAARCPVPLVSVPQGWRPSVTEAVVTVGVQDAEEAETLIRRGLSEARARGGRLEVLHAWILDGGYDAVMGDSAALVEHEQRVAKALAPALRSARRELPEVPVRLRVQHAGPTAALLERADSSQLLVLGRRHHLLPLGSHLGPVVRAVLQHSTAPVLLNPELPREVPVEVDTPQPSLGLAPA
jgi:nucleotide-binding universal stress UspA family protein